MYKEVYIGQAGGPARSAISGGPNQSCLIITHRPMMCCGVSSLEGLDMVQVGSFNSKAALLQTLYQQNKEAFNYIYIATIRQEAASVPKLFLEIGAERIHTWGNLRYPDKHKISMFMVNINNAIGKYLDKDGVALPYDMTDPKAKVLYEQQQARIADRIAKGLPSTPDRAKLHDQVVIIDFLLTDTEGYVLNVPQWVGIGDTATVTYIGAYYYELVMASGEGKGKMCTIYRDMAEPIPKDTPEKSKKKVAIHG